MIEVFFFDVAKWQPNENASKTKKRENEGEAFKIKYYEIKTYKASPLIDLEKRKISLLNNMIQM